MTIIPVAPVGRVIREAGAERISENASAELARILEEYGIKISNEAIALARHAGRKTVKEEDIKMAVDIARKTRD
ncbi:histone family protein [Methanohalophilus portucalensis]|uniref:Archaeal histone n=3 Tax=Methanohalophilus TaxID=2175 RepID=A0A1L9C3E0_9EURY|nr:MULTISPECIES: histone family protein [Methanohalophilus]ATU07544.1 histone [Methanohalophilus portucalensis]OJH48981.1 archaeal histone [Methanohalophilus portucalensis FDF-1]RNI10274.1 histone family protein [Methanohalophilus portucalensis FDF-1]RNI13911.1 histone family protein [Methanohalophilus sp. RSK]SMH38172.1 archaeal histone [Methanohalophilus portucalensis FDF-1]